MDIAVKNLMFDVASGIDIFDAEQERVISKKEANNALRQACFELLGLNEKSTERDFYRAMQTPQAREFFNVIEEIIDKEVETGWKDNEFFNQFVEIVNMKDGDKNEFWVNNDDVILTVAQVAGDHHDITIQRLGEGQSYSIPTSYYAVKVGSDLRLFMTGRRDWNELITAVAKAYAKKIQDTLYTEVMSAGDELPAQFRKTGSLSDLTKDTFDTLIEDVEMANDGAPVVIMGTKTALKKINALAAKSAGSVTWVSDRDKDAISSTGILGDYEGTLLVEIPQRFENNNTAQKLVANDKLLIMPQVENKFVKLVDYGETTLQVNEIGAKVDDMGSFEAQRRMGVGNLITKYYGQWTITV